MTCLIALQITAINAGHNVHKERRSARRILIVSPSDRCTSFVIVVNPAFIKAGHNVHKEPLRARCILIASRSDRCPSFVIIVTLHLKSFWITVSIRKTLKLCKPINMMSTQKKDHQILMVFLYSLPNSGRPCFTIAGLRQRNTTLVGSRNGYILQHLRSAWL